jgi:hypothetical protein
VFTWVSAAADDRTFVLAAQRYWPIASGTQGAKAQERDNTTATRFFEVRFSPSRGTARLTKLASAGKVESGLLYGIALSPDATRLALDINLRSIQVITLATGARREWRWPDRGQIGNWKPNGQVLSWTADGRMLAFQQWGGGRSGNNAHVRVLDTAAPGNSLLAAKLVVTFPARAGVLTLNLGNTLITPDGSKIVAGTMMYAAKRPYATTAEITEFSTLTGKIESSRDQFRSNGELNQNVLWTSPSGATLIVSDPRGKAPGAVLGVLSGNRFTALPRAPQTNQIAW